MNKQVEIQISLGTLVLISPKQENLNTTLSQIEIQNANLILYLIRQTDAYRTSNCKPTAEYLTKLIIYTIFIYNLAPPFTIHSLSDTEFIRSCSVTITQGVIKLWQLHQKIGLGQPIPNISQIGQEGNWLNDFYLMKRRIHGLE